LPVLAGPLFLLLSIFSPYHGMSLKKFVAIAKFSTEIVNLSCHYYIHPGGFSVFISFRPLFSSERVKSNWKLFCSVFPLPLAYRLKVAI